MPWKILVVDDDDLTRIMFHRMLSRLGYDVMVASNGIEAEHTACFWQPHVILLDFHMPSQDGCLTSQHLRQRGYRGYIMLISVMSSPECLLSHCGANIFIRKPVTMANLRDYLSIKMPFYHPSETIEGTDLYRDF